MVVTNPWEVSCPEWRPQVEPREDPSSGAVETCPLPQEEPRVFRRKSPVDLSDDLPNLTFRFSSLDAADPA